MKLNYKGYTFDTVTGQVIGRRGRPLTNRDGGYIELRDGLAHAGMAHRILWELLYGEIPKGMQVNHKNGVKTDNRPDNLELVTGSENLLHAYANGLSSRKGIRNTQARLSDADVSAIRSAPALHGLAERFGVTRGHIQRIRARKSWVHVA